MAAAPVEGADRRAGLRLNGPGRAVLGQLQEERPEARAPAEEALPAAAAGVPEVGLTLGDGRQQTGPLAAHLQGGIVQVLRQVAERVPGRAQRLEALAQEVGLGQVGMRGRRKAKWRAVPGADQKDTLAHLRHAIVRGVELGDGWGIGGPRASVDRLDAVEQEPESLALGVERHPGHVLEQEGTRPRVAQHPQVLLQRAGAGIVQALGLAAGPEPGLREGLAGRTADQDIGLSGLEARRLQDLVRREGVDVAPQHRPARTVLGERLTAHGVQLDGHAGLEARRLEAEVKAADTGVQADQGGHRRLALLGRMLATASKGLECRGGSLSLCAEWLRQSGGMTGGEEPLARSSVISAVDPVRLRAGDALIDRATDPGCAPRADGRRSVASMGYSRRSTHRSASPSD